MKNLLSAAKVVLAGLEARVEAADQSAVPVFDGIADLASAIRAEERRVSPSQEAGTP